MQRELDGYIKTDTKAFLHNMQPRPAKNKKPMSQAQWLLLLPWALASSKPEFDEWSVALAL